MRTLPLILAPMAGGPSSPELLAAAAAHGAVSMVAGGSSSAAAIAATFAQTKQILTRRYNGIGRIGVNFFVPEGNERGAEQRNHF